MFVVELDHLCSRKLAIDSTSISVHDKRLAWGIGLRNVELNSPVKVINNETFGMELSKMKVR